MSTFNIKKGAVLNQVISALVNMIFFELTEGVTCMTISSLNQTNIRANALFLFKVMFICRAAARILQIMRSKDA